MADDGAGAVARPAVWPPFVRAALRIALIGGFGLGGALAVAVLTGLPFGPWWRAAAQAHGHAQLFGWLGLTVLGVGLHFLPRLRGAAPPRPRLAKAALALVAGGIAARLVCAPLVALAPPGVLAVGARAGLVAAAAAELVGFAGATALLTWTLRRGPPLAERAGLRPVLPFFVVGFAALVAASAVAAAGTLETALGGGSWLPAWSTGLSYDLALELFIVPLCVGMSARTFPLFFRTPLPRTGVLRSGLFLLVAGAALRAVGDLGLPLAVAAGAAAGGAALLLFVAGLGILGPVRPLPRDPIPYPPDPARLHGQTAYAWLLLAGLLRLAAAADRLGLVDAGLAVDAERHVLGAGFATLLVLGVGAHLLPAFARRGVPDRRLTWATLVLGNGAALARAGPSLWPGALSAAGVYGLFALAGLLGLAALLAFRAGALYGPSTDARPGS
jgi:uncharacterized protein involved in response to NO